MENSSTTNCTYRAKIQSERKVQSKLAKSILMTKTKHIYALNVNLQRDFKSTYTISTKHAS